MAHVYTCPPNTNTYMILSEEPRPHGQHGEIHGETTWQVTGARDEHSSTEQQEPQCQAASVGPVVLAYSPETATVLVL